MKYAQKTSAVSPIVATLVLIVVAVVGAVAVGTIMGTFSNSVSKQTDASQAASASQTEILTAGSTTVYPASLQIAKLYMDKNKGIKITVQPGGSGAGVTGTGLGTIDIGATSDYTLVTSANSDHPDWDLRATQIGGSGILIVTNSASALAGVGNITTEQLLGLFTDGVTKDISGGVSTATAGSTGITTVVYRAESSGTADTFYKTLGFGAQKTPAGASGVTYSGQTGNEGVIQKVQSTNNSIGFLDMGYARPTFTDTAATSITVLGLDDSANHRFGGSGTVVYNPIQKNLKTACKDLLGSGLVKGTDYPFVRGLYYLTKGAPTPVEQNYIGFAASPGACGDLKADGTPLNGMHAAGVFCNADLSLY